MRPISRFIAAAIIGAISAIGTEALAQSSKAPFVGCPDSGWTEAELFPDFDRANEASFSRTQAKGNCTAYSVADKVCADLKKMNVWPADIAYRKGCSAIDMDLQVYATLTDPQRGTIADFISDQAYAADEVVERVRSICPEAIFPSEIFVSGEERYGSPVNDMKLLYRKIAERLRTIKTNPAAKPSLSRECPECKLIAPTLTEEQWIEVRRLIGDTDLDRRDFSVLQRINKLVCSELRIPLPKGYALEELSDHRNGGAFGTIQAIKRRLSRRETVTLTFDANHIDPIYAPRTIPPWNRMHTVLVAGAVENPIAMSKSGRDVQRTGCYYAIKNSWGPKTCEATMTSRESDADVMCVEGTGEYLISEDLLYAILKDSSNVFGLRDTNQTQEKR